MFYSANWVIHLFGCNLFLFFCFFFLYFWTLTLFSASLKHEIFQRIKLKFDKFDYFQERSNLTNYEKWSINVEMYSQSFAVHFDILILFWFLFLFVFFWYFVISHHLFILMYFFSLSFLFFGFCIQNYYISFFFKLLSFSFLVFSIALNLVEGKASIKQNRLIGNETDTIYEKKQLRLLLLFWIEVKFQRMLNISFHFDDPTSIEPLEIYSKQKPFHIPLWLVFRLICRISKIQNLNQKKKILFL